MIALLGITTLTLATLFALAAATAFHWLLLRVAFHLMRPAAARRVMVRYGIGASGRHRWPGLLRRIGEGSEHSEETCADAAPAAPPLARGACWARVASCATDSPDPTLAAERLGVTCRSVAGRG